MLLRIQLLLFSVLATISICAQHPGTLEKTLQALENKKNYDSLIKVLEHSIHYTDVSQAKKKEHMKKLVQAYLDKEDYPNASNAALTLIRWLEAEGVSNALAGAYMKKATTDYYLDNLRGASEYAEKAYNIHTQLHDTTGIIKGLIHLGILKQEMKDNKAALQYYRRAKKIPIHDYDLLSNLYSCFSVAFSALNRHDSSLYYIQQSLALDKKLSPPNESAIVNSFLNLAATYDDLGNYKMTIQYLDSTKQYNWGKVPHKLITKILSQYYSTYFKMNNPEQGRLYLQNYIRHHEKVFEEKMNAELKELSVSHENEKILQQKHQQAEIKALQLQQGILLLLVIVLLMVIAAGAYAYFSNKKKNKIATDKIKIEQRLLRTQMNPHFILNTLAGIQMLVEDNQNEKASLYLNNFARLMQITLENSRENFTSISSEIKALEKYLFLQHIRFEDEFDYAIQSSGLEDNNQILIPPMIIQPFVENAIQHGVRSLDRKGSIHISINITDHTLVCIIDDNGKGLHPKNGTVGKQSLSTQIVRERLAILSTELKREASLVIVDKKSSGEFGVRVTLTIPYTTC